MSLEKTAQPELAATSGNPSPNTMEGVAKQDIKDTCDVDEKSPHGAGDADVFIDPALNKRVLRRLDYRFAPLFCALYFMYVFPQPSELRGKNRRQDD